MLSAAAGDADATSATVAQSETDTEHNPAGMRGIWRSHAKSQSAYGGGPAQRGRPRRTWSRCGRRVPRGYGKTSRPRRPDLSSAPATTTIREIIAMDRRSFIASAAGAGATLATAGPALAEEGAMTKRFAEQRWALDNIIRANGIDWDQPRS